MEAALTCCQSELTTKSPDSTHGRNLNRSGGESDEKVFCYCLAPQSYHSSFGIRGEADVGTRRQAPDPCPSASVKSMGDGNEKQFLE
jgi:hypothetical protein